jgi:hypothetical protein
MANNFYQQLYQDSEQTPAATKHMTGRRALNHHTTEHYAMEG